MTSSPYARLRAQGWRWRPSTDVVDPELKYWLSRTEETCRRSPSLSTDLIRASKVEIDALVRSKDRLNRWSTHMVCFIASVALGVGWGHYLGPDVVGAPPWHYIVPAVVLAWLWRSYVRPRINDRFAHRAVVARDRLNRWLAPAQPNYLHAAPQRIDQQS